MKYINRTMFDSRDNSDVLGKYAAAVNSSAAVREARRGVALGAAELLKLDIDFQFSWVDTDSFWTTLSENKRIQLRKVAEHEFSSAYMAALKEGYFSKPNCDRQPIRDGLRVVCRFEFELGDEVSQIIRERNARIAANEGYNTGRALALGLEPDIFSNDNGVL